MPYLEPSDRIYATEECILLNPVECGTGRHNFLVYDGKLASMLAESFDCGFICNPDVFEDYN